MVFGFTVRPILGALGASIAAGGSAAILFFCSVERHPPFLSCGTQRFGYKAGAQLSGGMLGKITGCFYSWQLFIIVAPWYSAGFPFIYQLFLPFLSRQVPLLDNIPSGAREQALKLYALDPAAPSQ